MPGSHDVPEDDELGYRNEVILSGRVAIPASERSLPSGDTVLTTRIIVDRVSARGRRGAGARRQVDAIDCAAWPAKLRQVMRRWQPGDRVLVSGSIRRRFFRSAGGPVSRFEVEVSTARRLGVVPRTARSRAAPPADEGATG